MPTSSARIEANRRDAAKSGGPRTPEGKERSRADSLEHGPTGAGVVLPEAVAVEVERRAAAFSAELSPSGELGVTLIRRAALLSVRMEALAVRETAAVAENVRRAGAEFEAPEGVDRAEAARLRLEAGKRAMFDPSKEACLARRYEAAAERGFFRALKELRLLEGTKSADSAFDAKMMREMVGSLLQGGDGATKRGAMDPGPGSPAASWLSKMTDPSSISPLGDLADVPFTIGRRR
jgi:hypothetical protein